MQTDKISDRFLPSTASQTNNTAARRESFSLAVPLTKQDKA